jgi:hypothetical protein
MSASLEKGPDRKLTEALAVRIMELCREHVVAWGAGNKPRFEALAALAYAYAAVWDAALRDLRKEQAARAVASDASQKQQHE